MEDFFYLLNDHWDNFLYWFEYLELIEQTAVAIGSASSLGFLVGLLSLLRHRNTLEQIEKSAVNKQISSSSSQPSIAKTTQTAQTPQATEEKSSTQAESLKPAAKADPQISAIVTEKSKPSETDQAKILAKDTDEKLAKNDLETLAPTHETTSQQESVQTKTEDSDRINKSAPSKPPRATAETTEKREKATTKTAAEEIVQDLPWERALKKSREPLFQRIKEAFSKIKGEEQWNSEHPIWEELEEALIISDLGPRMTESLLESLKQDFKEKPDFQHLVQKLRRRMLEVFEEVESKESGSQKPHVTLLMGVNGAGKTTTAGKLALKAKNRGQSVILGAGDTFRAAAVEQLQAWADRIDVQCVAPARGANPAAVAFDTVATGLANNIDEIIIDTAGRLHTKDSLMDELKKVGRVIDKKIPQAPHQVLLVLDATLGQNAILQAKEFTTAIPATGVVLTKLDGSSKGGAALSVVADLKIPVKYVGVGESADDLREFSAKDFVENLIPDTAS